MSLPKSQVMSDDTRLALLEQSIGHIDQTLIRIERRIDEQKKETNEKFEKIDKRFERIDSKFDQIDSQLKWMTTTILTLFGGLYAIMFAGGISWSIAKIFHWS